MRENRPYGSEGGGPQLNAASLPLSWPFPTEAEPHDDFSHLAYPPAPSG